jgi:hypothetical protein
MIKKNKPKDYLELVEWGKSHPGLFTNNADITQDGDKFIITFTRGQELRVDSLSFKGKLFSVQSNKTFYQTIKTHLFWVFIYFISALVLLNILNYFKPFMCGGN